MSQAYRTFAEGREDLENGKFDRNTGCRKKVRGTDGSGPCEPFCHTRKNIWNHRKERKRQDSSFKSICGFVLPDAGKILVRGKQVGKDVDIPQGIGIIIEHPGFLRDYSGFQNLKLLARLQKKITDEKIKESIRLVGLDPEDKKKVGKFSLGMRQRLGIAQAIMESPDILILDEPMNGLDKHGVEDMRKLLVQLKEEGTTILVASHNPLDIEILCDEVYEMDAGAITKVH